MATSVIVPSRLRVVEGVFDGDMIAGGERAEAFDALHGAEGRLIE